MSDSVFRIHPAIGFARVGTSERYYLAPETPAGHPLPGQVQTGGLPIKAGSEDQTITSDDVRDREGKFLRQAARFRIYQYPASSEPHYPMGTTQAEITIGSTLTIDGVERRVVDILWTVHVANKKTNWYQSADDTGILSWGSPAAPTVPPLRNPKRGDDPESLERRKTLIIDPGPRTIRGAKAASVEFDARTEASYGQGAAVTPVPNYPKSFPGDHFQLFPPGVEAIDTLGQLETDERGRLIVVGAYGRANSFLDDPASNYGFTDAVNNDWWFDDTCDGPVDATLVFDDGSVREVEGAAWVVSTDPSYAPQILNVVSLWDDIHDSWVRKLGLRPDLYSGGAFNPNYQPSFEDEVRPIFLAAGLQRWITNLSALGISAHARVASYTGDTAPASTQLHGLGLIRKPVDPEVPPPANPDREGDDRMMPLSLGDAGRSLLSLSETQYFYLQRWDAAQADKAKPIVLGPGELLDKASFAAGLGGRFSPGIDLTYICREPDLYVDDWARTGPFRVSPASLDYAAARKDTPLLHAGWTPKRNDNAVEPGDICKFMAIPWHADYNSCGTHLPDPNPEFNNTLYWSWPAQRPVAVYAAKDVVEGKLGKQVFSVRGPGTKTAPIDPAKPPAFGPGNPAEVGRYQVPFDMLAHWHEIGIVMQATNIVEGDHDPSFYLEVASQLPEAESDKVQAWPNTVAPGNPS